MVIIPYFSVIDNHRKHVTLKLYLSYVRSNFMTDYEQIFLSSGQEKQKLTIALKRFIETEDPDWKARYQSYLRTRFRPAMTELIHGGDLARIRNLCAFAPLTAPALEQFIQEASICGRTEILAFLLRLKKDSFGFHDRDFSL